MISNSGPGRPRGLLPWGSHRSVRALSGIRLVTSWVRIPLASCCLYVHMTSDFKASVMLPSSRSMTWHPLLSTGSLGVVPPLQRYYGTLRLPAARLSSFRILHEPIPLCRPWFDPLGRERPTGGQGVVGSGLPIRIDDGNVGGSQVPWKPWWSLSVLFDPGRIRQAEWTKSKLPDTAPACVHDEGSRRLVLSGLNHTTFDLTVYASQDGSPTTTQDSLLAGPTLPGGIRTRRVSAKGFRVQVLLSKKSAPFLCIWRAPPTTSTSSSRSCRLS